MRKIITLVLLPLLFVAGCGGTPAGPSTAEPDGTATARETQPAPATPELGSTETAQEIVVAPSTTPLATAEAEPTHSGPSHVPAAPATPADPPDSSAMAVFLYNVPDDGSLRAFHVNSGQEIVLGDPTSPQQNLPWSAAPDGSAVALITGSGWGTKAAEPGWSAALWTVSIDGGQARKLLDLLPPGGIAGQGIEGASLVMALTNPLLQQPAWTSEGNAIIVASAHEGQVDLYAVALDGSEVRRLTNSPALEVKPSISPDDGEVAYISAASFGTGAGWGEVNAQAIPLSGGEPRRLLAPVPGPAPAGAEILGWTQAGAVLIAAYYPQPALVISSAGSEGGPVIVYQGAGAQAAWNAASQRLAIVAADPAQPQSGSRLLLWSPGQAEPEEVAALSGPAVPRWEPGGQAVLLCSTHSATPQLALWKGQELKQLGEGSCREIAWSELGWLAVSGEGQALIEMVDGSFGRLPAGGIVAGWYDHALYYFEQQAGQGWQLTLRTDHEQAPIGRAISQEPERMQVVLAR